MKILHINATYGVGSTGMIVRDLCSMTFENGWETSVVAGISSIDLSQNINVYNIGNLFDHKLHALLSRVNGMQAYYSKLPTIKLVHYIDSIKPDVVHLHNLHSNYIHLNILLDFLAKANIRTVVTLHDCWFYTGGCFHYTDAKCDKWQANCGHCPKKYKDTPAFFFDKSSVILKDRYEFFRRIKQLKVVGVSEWIADECQKSVFKGRDVSVIHNGVDMSIFKPTNSDIRHKLGIEGKYVILGPASKWMAGINAEALAYFSNNMQEDECLVLFGCRTKKIGLSKNIIQYGFTHNREELAALYSAADVFVNLTHEDSLSFINLEAQACGTKVLTYNNTGAKETVDGIISKTVETADYVSVLKEVRRMKKNRNDDTSQLSIDYIKRHFEKNSNYAKYMEIYELF